MQPDHNGKSLLSRDVLAKLHIAKKALCLDDEEYRDILERITGHRSAREIMPDQVPALQRELRRLGWDGWLLRYVGARHAVPLRYTDMDNRPGRPTGAQLRMLEARFVNIRGFADINPDGAFRQFLQKRFGISHAHLLDDETYEAALTAVKRLETQRGVKEPWKKGRR